ncbi:hypothetical protein ACLB1G_16540 [Oxalobacteraceae bacterium A2-2]
MSSFSAGDRELVPPASLEQLLAYLHRSRSKLSPQEAIARALADWIASQQRADTPLLGYQWKSLFLPEGTHLRMRRGEQSHFAQVQGGRLMFNGRAVSPSQMALAIAGEGRNAWRDLWVRFPGERQWQLADRLRRELAARPAAPPSPMEAMQVAAHSMSEALRSALVLVNHASLSAQNQVERRLPRHRRSGDILSDD